MRDKWPGRQRQLRDKLLAIVEEIEAEIEADAAKRRGER
jgi:hypothetical protein